MVHDKIDDEFPSILTEAIRERRHTVYGIPRVYRARYAESELEIKALDQLQQTGNYRQQYCYNYVFKIIIIYARLLL